jgi:hypothetical protein
MKLINQKITKGNLYDIIKEDLIIHCQALYVGINLQENILNFIVPNNYDKNIHLTKVDLVLNGNLLVRKYSISIKEIINTKNIIHFAGNHRESIDKFLKKSEYYIEKLPYCTQKIFLKKGIYKALYKKI